MKKRYILSLIFFGLILSVHPDLLHAQNELFLTESALKKSNSTQKAGMMVLGSWAAFNIATGTYGFYNRGGDRKYFYQMNAAWNLVNLGIAGFGFYSALNADMTLTGTEALQSLQKFDRILLINAGLDLLYIGTGAWLWNRGHRKNSDRLLGYGKSVVLQGSFLLLFDLALYFIHHPNTRLVLNISESVAAGPTGFRISF